MLKHPPRPLTPNLPKQAEAHMENTSRHSRRTSHETVNPARRWPLILIALPAAVAIWAGWVGLGGMCGFGVVQPFPGIVPWHLNTAITLPIGVEAYGAFALGVWLRPDALPRRARSFAKRSAIGALALGMAGQVVYHLLSAAGRTRAPWPVVVLVSCMPVAVLGLAAGLTHLLRAVPAAKPEPPAVPESYPAEPVPPSPDAEFDRLLDWLTSDSNGVPGVPELHRDAAAKFAGDLLAGELPSIRVIRKELSVGQDKATEVQAYLRTLNGSTSHA